MAWCARSLRCPPSRASSGSRRSSTTSSPWPRCRTSSSTARRRTPPWAPGDRWARRSSSWPGNIRQGGIVETAFGITLRELVEGYGARHPVGAPPARRAARRAAGGLPARHGLDVEMDYEAVAAAGGMLGHGGIVVFDDTVDMAQQARFAMEFCAEESCGKCTPCRIGSVRGVEVIDRILIGEQAAMNRQLLRRPLRGHDGRFTVRDGRTDSEAGAQRPAALRRGLRAEQPMTHR